MRITFDVKLKKKGGEKKIPLRRRIEIARQRITQAAALA